MKKTAISLVTSILVLANLSFPSNQASAAGGNCPSVDGFTHEIAGLVYDPIEAYLNTYSVDWHGCDLTGAIFPLDSHFVNSDFSSTTFTGFLNNFVSENSNFQNANFSEVNGGILSAMLSVIDNADFSNSKFDQISIYGFTNWGYPVDHLTSAQNIDFSNANIPVIDMQYVDISGSNFSGIQNITTYARWIRGVSTDFSGISFASIEAEQPNAGATRPEIFFVDVANSNFYGANLNGALIGLGAAPQGSTGTGFLTSYLTTSSNKNVNFSNVNFNDSYLFGNFIDSNFQGSSFVNTVIRGSTLSNQYSSSGNFRGSNFDNALFESTSIFGADFSASNLAGIKSKNVYLNRDTKLPASWKSSFGLLIGPGANLNYADLRAKDISGMNLSGASLNYANLASSNLSNTNLSGTSINFANLDSANLTGANLTGSSLWNSVFVGATWSNTTCVDGVNSDIKSTGICVAPLAQSPISVSNVSRNAYVGNTFTLTSVGGSGSGAVSFSVTGTGCSITSNNVLAATGVSTCSVTATKAASQGWEAATSSTVVFNFTLVPQTTLEVSNTATAGVIGTPITLTSSGGSGAGIVTFSVTGTGCAISSGKLSATGNAIRTCSVVATKAANGIYSAASSMAKQFTFGVAQKALVISNTVLTGTVGTPIVLATTGGSGAGAVTYSVTGTGCSISGANLSAAAVGSCVVTATKAAEGNFAAVTSATKTFVFSATRITSISILNTVLTNSLATPVQVQTNAAGGSSVIRYFVEGANCSISNTGLLTATTSTTCKVTAQIDGVTVASTIRSRALSFKFR